MRVVWAEQARQERASQYRFYVARNPDAARRMRTRVRERIAWLKQNPRSGRLGQAQGTRELVITGTPWVIVYQENPAQIEIVHFYHGRQDWQREMQEWQREHPDEDAPTDV